MSPKPSSRRQPPDGAARRSQVVGAFGPGAMVDLINDAVLIKGLDSWKFASRNKDPKVIEEPRLRDELAEQLRDMMPPLSIESAFRLPPGVEEREPGPDAGIEALEFPSWFVCQNPECRALAQERSGLTRTANHWVHACDGRGQKPHPCVPVRFVAACPNGHLDEFPWVSFVHKGQDGTCRSPRLKLGDGASGDFAEVHVSCTSCSSRRALIEAMVPEANPLCRGRRPWLGKEADEECVLPLRLLVRTASNSYFAQVVSALSIPEKENQLHDAVKRHWNVLANADVDSLPTLRKVIPMLKDLGSSNDAAVVAMIGAIAKGHGVARAPIRTAEFEQFRAAPPEAPGELPDPDDRFFVRSSVPVGGLPVGIGRVVLASKLREVRVQVGFSRFEPIAPNLQGEFDLGVGSQPLTLLQNWLPAVEILGEGLFVELDEGKVREWENREAVQSRGKELLAGYDAWAKDREDPPEFPGMRFYLLHSLAHLLMSALSLECGYAASALRERIYCAPAEDPLQPMAALLISTGTPGAEGTLGGLVEEGRKLSAHLARALDMGRLCSYDPVCAHHTPKGDLSERYLEGAACHGCLFVAESSCERFNRYLDRCLVVPTLSNPGAAFFEVTG